MYRIGKKQKRAILTADGNEVVVFPKGKEAIAEKVCNLLNSELDVNKISSNGMLAVSVLPTEERWDELQKLLIYEKQNAETFVDGNGSLKTNDIIKWMKKKVGVGKTDR